MGTYWAWWWTPRANNRRRREKKKERKARLQQEVYYRRLAKWEAREPSRWRILAHWQWRMEKPEMPKTMKED